MPEKLLCSLYPMAAADAFTCFTLYKQGDGILTLRYPKHSKLECDKLEKSERVAYPEPERNFPSKEDRDSRRKL